MFLAEVTTIGLAVLGLVSLIGGAILYGSQKFKSPVTDKEPSTYASRGAYIPVIVGRERTGPVILWVGRRKTSNVSSGGKGLFGGGPTGKKYAESAMHAICVGPAIKLHEIYVDGVPVLTPTHASGITSTSHPSGTRITLDKVGSFKIYWGEPDQPVNTDLAGANQMGYGSRWPRVMYLHWDRKDLGGTPRWANVEYVPETEPQNSRVSVGSSAAYGGGYNPAHILAQLIFERRPYGCGHDPALCDTESLDAFAAIAESEVLACRAVMKAGAEFERAIVDLLSDCGVFLVFSRGKLRFRPIRQRTDQMILREEHILDPVPELQTRIGHPNIDAITFTFADSTLRWRPNAFTIDDDGQAELQDARRGDSIDIPSVDTQAAANVVASRRSQEEAASRWLHTLRANRAARTWEPGDVFFLEPYPASLRILTVKPEADSGRCEITAAQDYYGVVHPTIDPMDGVGDPALPAGPTADVAGVILAIPTDHPVGGAVLVANPSSFPSVPLIIPRIRAHQNIEGAEIHISADDITFRYLGFTRVEQFGGELSDAISAGTPGDIETAIKFDVLGDEDDVASLALDLSSDTTSRDLGLQLLIVGSEIMTLEKVEADSPGVWELINFRRGMYGTAADAHSAGAAIFVINAATVPIWVDPIFQSGLTLYVKVVPFTSHGALPIASVSSISYTIP